MPLTGVTNTPSDDVAVAFANTACPDATCHAETTGFPDLLKILATVGAIDEKTARRLLKNYGSSPQAQAAARELIAFRETISRALEARLQGQAVPVRTLEHINNSLSACGCGRELVIDAEGYRTRTLFEIRKPADVLMPLAHSIAEVLTSVDPTRIKQCREPRCTCYFIDTSKNRTRTWCSMQRCGNRQKVANYYRRSHLPRVADARSASS